MSDTASHFKNRVMKTLEGALWVEQRFAVANLPWSNGTCERMMPEVVHALKELLQEKRRNIRAGVDVVSAGQWALNTAYCERYASTPHHVLFGRAPLTSFLTVTSSTGEDWKMDALDEAALRREVANVVDAQQRLHKVVEERGKKPRDRQRQASSRGKLPNFAVGDYLMVARVRRPGLTPKLVSTWTGPRQIVTADKVHVYGVQNTITGDVKDGHVVRLRFCADIDLEMTAALKEVFQHAFTQGELEMAGIVDISEAEERQGFDVKVDWVGSDEGESSCEPLAIIWHSAP